MNRLIDVLANVAGVVGVVLCLAAGIGRIAGAHDVAGLAPLNLLLVGTGLMVAACLGKLQVLVARSTPRGPA